MTGLALGFDLGTASSKVAGCHDVLTLRGPTGEVYGAAPVELAHDATATISAALSASGVAALAAGTVLRVDVTPPSDPSLFAAATDCIYAPGRPANDRAKAAVDWSGAKLTHQRAGRFTWGPHSRAGTPPCRPWPAAAGTRRVGRSRRRGSAVAGQLEEVDRRFFAPGAASAV